MLTFFSLISDGLGGVLCDTKVVLTCFFKKTNSFSSVFAPLLMAMASYCGISRIGKPSKTNNIKQSETVISSPALCPFQEALGCMQVSGPSQCSQSFSEAIFVNIYLNTIGGRWYFWKGSWASKAHKPGTLS